MAIACFAFCNQNFYKTVFAAAALKNKYKKRHCLRCLQIKKHIITEIAAKLQIQGKIPKAPFNLDCLGTLTA